MTTSSQEVPVHRHEDVAEQVWARVRRDPAYVVRAGQQGQRQRCDQQAAPLRRAGTGHDAVGSAA